jgi:hypothetical protein
MDDQPAEHPPRSPSASGPPPVPPGPSDRGLMILVIVLGLAFMAFVLLAGVVGLTP